MPRLPFRVYVPTYMSGSAAWAEERAKRIPATTERFRTLPSYFSSLTVGEDSATTRQGAVERLFGGDLEGAHEAGALQAIVPRRAEGVAGVAVLEGIRGHGMIHLADRRIPRLFV